MKTIYLTLAFFFPLIATAQEHLIKKTRDQIRAAQQDAKSPLLYSRIGKSLMSNYDHFHCSGGFDLFCYYRGDTCLSVIAERNIGTIDSMRRELNLSKVKVKKDLWINQDGSVKIKLITYKLRKKFDLNYLPVNKE